MPLLFNSLSHGVVSFGFYNIETDGLLLGQHFFFCTDFCIAMKALFRKPLGRRRQPPRFLGTFSPIHNGSAISGGE